MNNIVLIGMPGAGKSTIGVVLAKILNYQFLDSDLLIQQRENKRLCEIIEERGTDGFREVEDEVNGSIEAERTVIATGGSVVYCTRAMEHLMDIGTIVYLRLSLQALTSRLNNLKGRGVVLKEGQTLEELYQERIPLYESYAQITVDCERQSLEESLQAVLDGLEGVYL